jgi:hypothetical protein
MIDVNLTVIQIQSEEIERTVMLFSVHADLPPFHESQIGSMEEALLLPGLGVRARPRAEDPAIADVADKIGDLRGLVLGSRRKVVDKELFAANGKGDAPGKRLRIGMVLSPGPAREQEFRTEHAAGQTDCGAEKPAP